MAAREYRDPEREVHRRRDGGDRQIVVVHYKKKRKEKNEEISRQNLLTVCFVMCAVVTE